MHSFKNVQQHVSITNSDVYSQSQFYLRGDGTGKNGTHIADLGELEQTAGNSFQHVDAFCLSRSKIFSGSMYNGIKASNLSVLSSNLQFGGLSNRLCSAEIGPSSGGLETGQLNLQKGGTMGFGGGGGGGGGGARSLENGHVENWADSGVVADHSHQTDASTDTDDKNQSPGVNDKRLNFVDSTDQSKGQIRDRKALLKLAQNREAARKSRLRKKAYVQQLESSQQKLVHLEQDLIRARPQGIFVRSEFSGDQSQSIVGSCVVFDVEHTHWLDEHQRLINDLRSAINSHVGDNQLQLVVEAVMSNYDELYRIKSSGAKSDIFHVLSGIWKTPTERFFMWLGGSRCSDILKVLGNQIEPLTEQQLVGICNLQRSSQQAEDALSQGIEALQQSIVETLSYNSHTPNVGNVDDYMDQMVIAMSKIATLENFLHQADFLRLQTLQQLQRILTTRQTARALLAINDYKSRLRALSSLWQARPKE